MPELPEVETVTQSIKKHLLNKSFQILSLNWDKTLHNFSIKDFNNQIKNKKIKNIFSRGKFIVFDFNTQEVLFEKNGDLLFRKQWDKYQ